MIATEAKQQFKARALKDGMLIERVISQFYAEASANWKDVACIDGGAHLGLHTRQLCALSNVQEVLAVEASDEVYGRFLREIPKWPGKGKVRPFHAALQDDPSVMSVSFLKSTSHPGRSGINPVFRNSPGTVFAEPQLTPAITLDMVAETTGRRIAFIKLDLEGAEYFALRGGQACISKSRPAIVFENGVGSPRRNGYTAKDLAAMFDAMGFSVFTAFGEPFTDANLEDFWYAWAFDKNDARQHVPRILELMSAI